MGGFKWQMDYSSVSNRDPGTIRHSHTVSVAVSPTLQLPQLSLLSQQLLVERLEIEKLLFRDFGIIAQSDRVVKVQGVIAANKPLPVQTVQLQILHIPPGLSPLEVTLEAPREALVLVFLVDDLDPVVIVCTTTPKAGFHLKEGREVCALSPLAAVGVDLETPLISVMLGGGRVHYFLGSQLLGEVCEYKEGGQGELWYYFNQRGNLNVDTIECW